MRDPHGNSFSPLIENALPHKILREESQLSASEEVGVVNLSVNVHDHDSTLPCIIENPFGQRNVLRWDLQDVDTFQNFSLQPSRTNGSLSRVLHVKFLQVVQSFQLILTELPLRKLARYDRLTLHVKIHTRAPSGRSYQLNFGDGTLGNVDLVELVAGFDRIRNNVPERPFESFLVASEFIEFVSHHISLTFPPGVNLQ